MEGRLDLRRMMGVIVDDGKAVHLALILEPAVCAGKVHKTLADDLRCNVERIRQSDGSQGVQHIVCARYVQMVLLPRFTVLYYTEGGVS